MRGKTVGVVALVLGTILIVAALAVKLVILPSQAQWPDDVDSTRTYDGTLHVMLNPQALQSMDIANLFLRDVPITNSRHVTTEEVDGNKAIVREVAKMHGPDGQEIQGSDTWYAIDRKTMNAITKEEASAFSNSDKITDRDGLVIGFPIGTEKKTYAGWSSDFQKTLMVNYVEEEQRGELDTYVFESSSSPKELVDPEMLALFPPAIPKELLIGLSQTIDLPASMLERFADLLPSLPDPVPLKYTYEYETTYWVEPATGVLIDYDKHEAYKVALEMESIPVPVPITPVFEQSYHTSPSSIEDAIKDAKDAKKQLNAFGTILPLALAVIGLVLVVAGVLVTRASARRSRVEAA
jgi:hypothetical protein